MNDLIVKSVDVLGDSIMAAKDKNGVIWVGVRWMCQGMGMTEGQWKRQIKNIQKDLLLKEGGSNLTLPTASGDQDVFCLKNDYLPIWLAKIAITKNIQENHPELANKLLEYQLKAKDILANAFIEKNSTGNMGTIQQQIQLIAQGTTELYEKVETLTDRMDKIEMDLPILPIEADRITEAVRRKGVAIMGGKQSAAYQDRGVRQKVYNNIYANLKYNFAVRSYKAIKRSQCDRAIEIINNWNPPVFLLDIIEECNNQMTLDI